jgi:hypothetical protein
MSTRIVLYIYTHSSPKRSYTFVLIPLRQVGTTAEDAHWGDHRGADAAEVKPKEPLQVSSEDVCCECLL